MVIGEDGRILAHHRKMCPTYWVRRMNLVCDASNLAKRRSWYGATEMVKVFEFVRHSQLEELVP